MGIDAESFEIIVDAVSRVNRDERAQVVSMIISEQALHTVRECADCVYVIDRGMTVWNGSVKHFFDTPESRRNI